MGEFNSVEDLAEATFALPSGAVVRLSDFAVVTDGFKEQEDLARFQGQPSVGVIINKRSDANTVKVAREVFAVVKELRPLLPPGYEIGIARDLSDFISKSVRDVLINIIIGIIITSLFLYVFLHDIRSTLIASLAMPTSIISTFILMFFADFTINMVTLMALGISIGILATNSIIVLENISRFIDEGHPPEEAAVKGSSEIAIAVIASTLTNIMVFTPIAYMSGIIGQFFRQFGLTVVFATVFSLLVSFTMAPMLATKLLKPSNAPGDHAKKEHRHLAAVRRFRERFFARWDTEFERISSGYKDALKWCLDHRPHTIATVVAIFFFALFLLSLVGGEFTPYSDEGYVSIQVTMPPGTPIEETEGVLADIEAITLTHKEVETVFMTVGEGNRGVNEGEIIIGLVDLSDRRLLTSEFINILRPELALIPEAEIFVNEASQGFGTEADLTILVTGPELDPLTNLAGEIKSIVDSIPGLVDVDTSTKDPQPEIRFMPDRDIISDHGINTADIYSVLRASYEGEVASVYRERGEEYDILVRLSESDRRDQDLFENLLIQTPQGFAPLSQFGAVERALGESRILRKDRQKLIEVTANIGTGTLGQYEGIITAGIEAIDIPEGYEVKFGGESERMEESFQALFEALFMAIILTYVVLAAILESYIHPLTILVTVPLGLIGTAVGLFVSGMSINIFSLMALVMLVGIVVNNAILILDYANELREEGKVRRQALLEACHVKFRAIVMSTLAIAFAILPQALGGADAGFQVAMAVVTMGGVLFSAVFTLFLIPVVYEYIDRFTIQGRNELTEQTRRR
jgi:HAE1 family hydrophobic/amphiphilic exporter-1